MTESSTVLAGTAPTGARIRFVRLVLTSVALVTAPFVLLLMPGSHGIKSQTPQLADWYGVPMLVVSFGLPALLAILAWFAPERLVRWLAIATPMVFAVGMAVIPLAAPEGHLVDHAPPWFNGIHALHGVILATALRRHWIWIYSLSHGVIITTVRVMLDVNGQTAAIVDGISATVFILILMATTAGVVAAAERLDAAAAEARARATLAVAAATREREETSINAMVHDDIMSVLLTASRPAPPAALKSQAAAALASIERLEHGDIAEDLPVVDVAELIETTVKRIVPGLAVERSCEGELMVPASAVIAVRDAAAEAARNTMRHGGDDTARTLTITADARALTVRLADKGPGFDIRKVAARRLGIQLSILERMRLVNGGSASIDSRPGRGTSVVLTWKEPT